MNIQNGNKSSTILELLHHLPYFGLISKQPRKQIRDTHNQCAVEVALFSAASCLTRFRVKYLRALSTSRASASRLHESGIFFSQCTPRLCLGAVNGVWEYELIGTRFNPIEGYYSRLGERFLMGGRDMVETKPGFEFIYSLIPPPFDGNHKNSSMCQATSYAVLREERHRSW